MRVGLVGPCNPWRLRPYLRQGGVPMAEPGVPVELLAAGLIEAGHQVVVYTLDQDCAEPRRLAGPDLVIHQGPYRRRHRMRDFFAVERAHLQRMIRADPPDILHAHWGYEYAMAAHDCRLVPVLVTQHDWAPAILRWQPTPYRLGRLLMYLAVLRRVRALVVTSPYVGDKLRRWFGRDSALVAPGLPADDVAAAPRRFPGGDPVLVAVNQGFSRFKNVRILLRAFPLIRAAIPGARLRLLGHGHQPGGPAEAWARRHGLMEAVEFIGQVPADQVGCELAAAHLMVHPSWVEAFGHVLVEAMAQGTPVVANVDAVAPAWVLGAGGDGVLAPCRRPLDLARACIDVLGDPARWEGLSAAGWRAVGRRFSIPAMTAAYLDLYRRCLAEAAADGVADDQP